MSRIVRGNIYDLPARDKTDHEIFETLAKGSSLIERIVSFGHPASEVNWYDQESDEWVVLLQGNASILFEDNQTTNLVKGDYLFIPAHLRHKVTYTSETPPCIWIAVHGKLSPDKSI